MPSAAGGRAAVLGAGIQGTCTALALERAGWAVDLVDRAPAPMQATSVRGEGKLHLGYVYANDRSRSTAGLMVEGALRFSELVDRWLPQPLDWSTLRSEPFLYAVLPTTMVEVEDLAAHYAWVDEQVAGWLRDGAAYAGGRTVPPVQPVSSLQDRGFGGEVQAAFATGEVAIDPVRLREHLVDGLHSSSVVLHGGRTVHGVARRAHGFTVTTSDAGGGESDLHADVVVNCLWEGRLAVDATLGIEPPRPWIYRLKYAVHGSLPLEGPMPPSTTFVLGPFGDVVRHAGDRIYASWYPACLAGTSTDVVMPSAWTDAMAGAGPPSERARVAGSTVDALATHLPALRGLDVDQVAAGVIVAWGETDIDEMSSELHRRSAIGVHEHDGYLSVDTGKLTTAPLFAQRVADLLGHAARAAG